MSECISNYYIFDKDIKSKVYFNDEIIKQGKCLYEVIRVIEGVPLFLERHLKRLKNSAAVASLELTTEIEEIKSRINTLIKVNNTQEGNIKLIFNYKTSHTSNNSESVRALNGIFLAYFIQYHYPSKEDYEKGVDTIFYHAERNNPNAKIIDAPLREKVNNLLKEKNVYEAILVDRNGYITEGSRSNVFMIQGRNVITAPVGTVLPGTTREVIMEICRNLSLNVSEQKIFYKDLNKMDAVFISGTSPKVLPLKMVDDMKFDSSKNPVLIKIMEYYDNEVENYIKKCSS